MSAPKQQIGLFGAVAIGFASMLGAGVFNVFGAAASETSALFTALFLAALVASLNATSVYQLARRTSRPGGVYSYARVEWNNTSSFIAGFSFVFGKIASIAAIAYVFGVYVFPGQGLATAAGAIVLLALLNILGINRTALVAAILAIVTTSYLLITTTVGISQASPVNPVFDVVAGPAGILSAASLIFFAFAGYARVATLGDEVRDPLKNIPRAIAITLIGVLAIYILVAVALTLTFEGALQDLNRPFNLLAKLVFPEWVTLLVVAGASLGSMLALLAGVSRTAATMAEDAELPKIFAKRNRFGSPWLAEVLIAAGAIILLYSNPYWQWMVGFSSFSVLLYYAIGHVAAFRASGQKATPSRVVQVLGFILCVALLLAVPGPAVWVSVSILVVALLVRWLVARRRAR
jgi:APA family basic amino acid/polyamine antiporter